MADVEILQVEGLGQWAAVGGIPITGGFGSDLCVDPTDPDLVWLLTDRGPNVDAGTHRKRFPMPGFVPRIGAFRLGAGRTRLERTVLLRRADGRDLTGLPPAGDGVEGELALGPDGRPLPRSASGIDPEGLAVLPDGSFWIAEEYGPALHHHDPEGRLLRRILPGREASDLPESLLARRPNHGFEGLAALADSVTLVAVVQGVLHSSGFPDDGAVSAEAAARIVLLDTRSWSARELLYPLDGDATFPSAVCAAGAGRVLVLEHDGLSPDDPSDPAWCKRIYRVRLPGGTWRPGAPAEWVEKELLLDLLDLGYPHDKPEGIDLVGPRTLLLVNDDDFGIMAGPAGSVVAKRLPALDAADRNAIWRITLDADV